MRAVILAAGSGSRLRSVVGLRPKCLAQIGDCTLIERQIRQLRAAGVERITAVLGYGKEDVEQVCGDDLEVIHNPDHASTNSLYSLWLARDVLADGFVVLNCDVLFHPALLERLLQSRHENALLMAPRAPGVVYSDEEMKVEVRNGCVAAIDKALAEAQADGENVGIAKFGREGAAVLGAQLDHLVAAGAVRDWLPRAFAAFSRVLPLHVVETATYPWIEIDFPDDYARACRDVLPALTADEPPAADPPRVPDDAIAITFGRMLHRV